jgi:diguanylate cyclase (GGDEF)-like protein
VNSIYASIQNNLAEVFFIYGLAFFTMGIAIFVQPVGKTKFKLANILRLLGWFGLIHGINEWLDGWIIIKGQQVSLDTLRLFVLFISYLFLFEFGRRIFRLEMQKYPPALRKISARLTWVVSVIIVSIICIFSIFSPDILKTGAMLVRYLLGFPGGILISFGFFLYYRYEKSTLVPFRVKKYFLGASISFFIYAVLGGLIVNKGQYFPSTWINSESFQAIIKIPVQLFRAVCALIAGWSTIGLLRIFNLEIINELNDEITKRKQSEMEREKLNTELLKSNEKLGQLALRDSHTGLYNHHYLKDALEAALSQAERQLTPLSVIMIDIDYFKSINDVYGHLFGDLVLKQFAGQLTKAVRPYDVVFRFAGEEFIIMSPDTNRANAVMLARRILDKVNSFNFSDQTHSVKLKLTLAVVSYPEDSIIKGKDLIWVVDQILNRCKEGGGNRVCSSQDVRIGAEIITQSADIDYLKDKLDKLTKRANQGLIETTLAFAKTTEVRDHYSADHAEKTLHYVIGIAQDLKLPKDNIERIKQAAVLHDLGKIGIKEEVLNKKSALSKEEFEEIKKHPQIAVDIIKSVKILYPLIPMILYHHERWDGQGYPFGLEKGNIPLEARIISIIDVYQALVSERLYHKAYSKEEAVEMIKKSSGTQFDPDIVNSFLKVLEHEKSLE